MDYGRRVRGESVEVISSCPFVLCTGMATTSSEVSVALPRMNFY